MTLLEKYFMPRDIKEKAQITIAATLIVRLVTMHG